MPVQYDTQVQYLKGVGPKLGDVLRKRGVATVGELLEWYPRTYEDRRAVRQISSLEPDQIVSITGTVMGVRQIPLGKRRIYEVQVGDSSGKISCKYFRVPYKGYFERFPRGQNVRVSGKVTDYRGRIEMHHPDIQPIYEDDDADNKDILIPLYTETEGLSPAKLRKLMSIAIQELVPTNLIPDFLPSWMRQEFNLLPRGEALRGIHMPDPEKGEEYLQYRSPAHRRVIFEEFFWMELNLASTRAGLRREKAPPMKDLLSWVDKVRAKLPFKLTNAQEKVFVEIREDMLKPHPMHRLVQGDVGSGKTLVALMAAAFAAENGYQTALMAPTEILAEQHYKNAQKFLGDILGLKIELITGHLTNKEHAAAVARVASGEVPICIGTHALIEDEVAFKNLGLVIVDEQHRFGVEQRNKLKKQTSPHFLVMTATPIPRTLAMTVYGDLDVSVIDELPPGRSPIVTRKVFGNKRDKVFDFMREQINGGRQAYVIYPLVEESEKMDLKDAVTEYEELKKRFPEFKIGLLHGRMKADEKEAVMNEFRAGNLNILVSTTVIEVGVDVPNANIMVIEHAERFGLSQLHQLRGRVGRGSYKSYCVLMLSYALSEDSLKRAEIIESTTDGFKIAEADLEMRGPGEFLGRRQSGLPGFKLANLVRDIAILKEARAAAQELIQRDPALSKPEHLLIKKEFERMKAAMVG